MSRMNTVELMANELKQALSRFTKAVDDVAYLVGQLFKELDKYSDEFQDN